ncbi:MAG: hypothetical protein KF859_06575 [Phycisphaeraceae bacterium]|nr:hypothetical protein [Phycisphaeraceae bacterium]
MTAPLYAPVYTLAVLPNGDAVAGGNFTSAGGVTVNRIARWNGSSWAPLGSGFNDWVYALAVMPNGDFIAGGNFTTAGGVAANRIARWNGSSWAPLGSGMNGSVLALAVLPSGDLVAGSRFSTSGGVTTNEIVRWDGASWTPLGSVMSGHGNIPPVVRAFAVLPSGELVVGGDFIRAGGLPSAYFARWTDTGIPWVARQPLAQSLEGGETLSLSATCASGYDFNGPVSFQWQRNGVPITDGPGGASPGGGTVSGASGSLPSPTNNPTATLTIAEAQLSDTGEYTIIFTNSCGSITSAAASISVEAYCPADFNQDGGVDGGDVEAFYLAWEAADPSADVNRDGGVDGNDVEVFFIAWQAGGCD